jgi:enoyl-CoA hydratase/carnithine racemase
VAGYFFNHFDLTQFQNFVAQKGVDNKPLWVELISNLSNAPFITIASIKGRTQGGGDELTLAFDLRYASREKAVFNQPETGVGLYAGGGGTNLLPRLVGRDRALEVFLSSDDYNADLAERYGWVTRTLPNAELDAFVNKLANRFATFDKTALLTVKKQVNSITLPPEAELQNSYNEFLKSLSWQGLQLRMPIFGGMYGKYGIEKVEQNMGFYIGEGNRQLQQK